MGERQKYKHHTFTLAVWDRPELGEHKVTVWGRFWKRSFERAQRRVEAEIVKESQGEFEPPELSAIKSVAEWPTQYLSNPAKKENDINNIQRKRHSGKIEWNADLEAHETYTRDYEKISDFADLRLLGHWALANQVEYEELLLTEALESV